MYILIKTLYICMTIFQKFATSSAIVHMTQNSLNGAKFYELRRSPQKIKDTFEVKAFRNFTPTVICDSDRIGLSLHENFADIRMFASEHSGHPECTRRFSLEIAPQLVTRIDGPCGVRKTYMGVPSSLVTYSIRIIVSHNPDELTEYDKIYDVTCSSHLKTMEVNTAYDIISPQATTVYSTAPQSKDVPKCRYSLHHDRVGGPKTASAYVGEVIYHRWKCSSPLYKSNSLQEKSPKYIFKVYACVVNDQNNRTYSIIDENGCSLDEEIIPTPDYDVENGIIYTPMCSAVDPSCRDSVPPKCKNGEQKKQELRKKTRRQLPEEMTIEQRLLRIHEFMNAKRQNMTVEVGKPDGNGIRSEAAPLEVETGSLRVISNVYEVQKLQHVLHSYQIWTWILCLLNVTLVVLCILVTFRLLKNKYIMDIKDKTKTVFRRVPF